MSLIELLREAGVTEQDAEAVVRQEFVAAGRPASLSASESHFLEEFGGIAQRDRTGAEATRALAVNAVANMAALTARSITVRQAADRLRVSESRVHHRVRDRALYAFKLGKTLRLPLFQFDGTGQPLPHLAAVVKALPDGLHPLTVDGFMTLPNPDLVLAGEAVSPVGWLAGGGDPWADAVVLASSVDQW